MKKLILLLLCISIGYACKKQTTSPIPLQQKIVSYCDTITCIQADWNALYKYKAQPSGDTNMTNHTFRYKYLYSDSIFDSSTNNWNIYHHYKMCNTSFNINIVQSQFINISKGKYNNGDLCGITTTSGNYAVFEKILEYH